MSAITFEHFKRDFRKERKLGQGNCATVHLVRRLKDGSEFALKIIEHRDLESLGSSFQEIQVNRTLNDQSIAQIVYYLVRPKYQSIDPNRFPQLYIIMEYCQQTLTNQINLIKNQRRKHYSTGELMDFLGNMVRVLRKMQQKNVLHRDIKPDNILIKRQNNKKIYKLCDFGYAVFNHDYSGQNITGTLQYVSPRIKQKFKNKDLHIQRINFKDDVYSLGKTLLHMITTQCFDQSKSIESLLKIVEKMHGRDFTIVLEKMLQYDQYKRFDFIQLEAYINSLKEIQSKNKNKVIQYIDLDNESASNIIVKNSQLIPQIYQNVLNLYQKIHHSKPRLALDCQSNQTFSSISYSSSKHSNILNLKQFFNSQASGKTVYQDINISTQSQNNNKGILEHYNLNIKQQIQCVNRLNNYVLLGLQNKVAVIDINNKGQVYYLTVKDKFSKYNDIVNTIARIIITQDYLIIVGVEKYVQGINKTQFIQEMESIVRDKSLLIESKQIKVINKERRCMRHKAEIKYYSYQKQIFVNVPYLYRLSAFELFFPQQTSITNKLNPIFKDTLQTYISGHQNGNICIKNQEKSTQKLLANERICFIKTDGENIIYQTQSLVIYCLPIILTENNNSVTLVSNPICKYELKSMVVFMDFFSNSTNDYQKVNKTFLQTPYLNILTYDGSFWTFNKHLNPIEMFKIKEGLMASCQSRFSWKISQDIQVKVSEGNNHLYTIDQVGTVYNVHLRQKIYESKINNASSLHIDSDFMIIVSLDGAINIMRNNNSQSENRKMIIENDKKTKQTLQDQFVANLYPLIVETVKSSRKKNPDAVESINLQNDIQMFSLVTKTHRKKIQTTISSTRITNNEQPLDKRQNDKHQIYVRL